MGATHVNDDEIQYVLPPDAIPAITEPKFGDARWLRDADKVIGFEHEGEARAYPLRILAWHEIVDDTVAGLPVAVTYCPLCGTGIVFDRRVTDEPLTFKVSGKLYKSDLVMYDTKTESLWSQVAGEGIQGRLHGRTLTALGSTLAPWSEWRAQHPDTKVLSRDTGHDRDYDRDPYAGYDSDRSIGISGQTRGDVRGMHPKEFVLGYEENGHALAFRYSRLAQAGFAQTPFHGHSLLATFHADTAYLFDAASWTFHRGPDGAIVDQDGSAWDPRSGTSSNGQGLTRLAGVPSFWFAWSDFHPDTLVWGSFGVRSTTPADGARRVNAAQSVTLEFSGPVNETQRGEPAAWLSVDPAVNWTHQWKDPQTLVVRAPAGWPFGTVTVTVDAAVRDANGTLMEVPYSASFTVISYDTPGPATFSVLLAAVGAVLCWSWRRGRRR